MMRSRLVALALLPALFAVAPPARAFVATIAFGVNTSVNPTNAFPTSLASGATYTTGIQPLAGVGISFCAQTTSGGTISIQRYLDGAGSVAVGTTLSQTMSAGTTACIAVNDGLPALYFQGSIAGTGGATAATISATGIVVTGAYP